jgi:hypothetical protein
MGEAMAIDANSLTGDWVHSHEEDANFGPDAMVFRDGSVPLGPSRGRWKFQLHADKSMTDIPPGAADRPETRSRSWSVNDQNQLVFSPASAGQQATVMDIIEASPDRLVLKKPNTTASQ